MSVDPSTGRPRPEEGYEGEKNSLSFSGTGGLSGAEVLRLPRCQREFGSMDAWDFEAVRSGSALKRWGSSARQVESCWTATSGLLVHVVFVDLLYYRSPSLRLYVVLGTHFMTFDAFLGF